MLKSLIVAVIGEYDSPQCEFSAERCAYRALERAGESCDAHSLLCYRGGINAQRTSFYFAVYADGFVFVVSGIHSFPGPLLGSARGHPCE